jgi:pimeloyl-ACP methyl ester carboxylesterase
MQTLRFAALLRAAGAALACAAAVATATGAPEYGSNLEGFAYPHAVELYPLRTQAQSYYMAYMDVGPDEPGIGTGRTAVLLHGRRFCGATWATTIAALHHAGFRVVVPDQLGFCKSSKPVNYQYSFEQLAMNTHGLLGHIQAGRIVLVDPLGLEDWRAEGVLYRTIDDRYRIELSADAQRIKQTEQQYYYGGGWRPQYDIWVNMLASLHAGAGRERYDWNQTLVSDMIFTQPVLYDLDRLAMPTLLVVGALDRAAPFRDAAPPAVAARLGRYPELARRAVQRIAHARLIELPGVGHVPQIEAPARFNQVLLHALASPPDRPSPPRR